jgi:hypothetical protein
VAEYGMRNSDRPAGLVESPVLSNGHAGFGRRAEETDRSKDRHRASSRPHYQALFLQARGELRTQLKLALRTGRAQRVPRGSTRPQQARIAGMVNISERPAEAADRAVPGHWEGDLIIGKGGKSQVATVVERHSRFVMLARIPYDRCADRVAIILSQRIGELPDQLRRSLTWDQGVEMAVMPSSRWPRMSRCSSAIRIHRGSVAVTRTRTGYSGSISPREPICRATLKPSSMRSQQN